jgi:hypothetical protein
MREPSSATPTEAIEHEKRAASSSLSSYDQI